MAVKRSLLWHIRRPLTTDPTESGSGIGNLRNALERELDTVMSNLEPGKGGTIVLYIERPEALHR